jgi:hypothetical protein
VSTGEVPGPRDPWAEFNAVKDTPPDPEQRVHVANVFIGSVLDSLDAHGSYAEVDDKTLQNDRHGFAIDYRNTEVHLRYRGDASNAELTPGCTDPYNVRFTGPVRLDGPISYMRDEQTVVQFEDGTTTSELYVYRKDQNGIIRRQEVNSDALVTPEASNLKEGELPDSVSKSIYQEQAERTHDNLDLELSTGMSPEVSLAEAEFIAGLGERAEFRYDHVGFSYLEGIHDTRQDGLPPDRTESQNGLSALTRYTAGYIARHGAEPKSIEGAGWSLQTHASITQSGMAEVRSVQEEAGVSTELKYSGNPDMELVSEKTVTDPFIRDGKPVTTVVIGDKSEARRVRDHLEWIASGADSGEDVWPF